MPAPDLDALEKAAEAAIAKIEQYHWPANMEIDPQTMLALVRVAKAMKIIEMESRDGGQWDMADIHDCAARALTGGE